MITIEVNGVRYTHFTQLSVASILDSIADTFKITATSGEMESFPINAGDRCRALINDTPIMTGFIASINEAFSIDQHNFEITGESKTVDLVDVTAGDNMVFKGDFSFKAFIESVLKQSKQSGIAVIDLVGNIEPLRQNEIQAAETGEPIFSFIERHARQRQVILTGNANGNIEIIRDTTQFIGGGFSLISRKNDANNNIKSLNYNVDVRQRFNQYVVKSQESPSSFLSLNAAPTAQDAASKQGIATDGKIRKNRILIMEAENSVGNGPAQARAKYEANIRRVRSETVQVTVAGHVNPNTKQPFRTNRLIPIDYNNVFRRINATMLINSVIFNLSNDQSETVLGLIDRSAYSIEAQKPIKQQRSDSFGGLLGTPETQELLASLTGGEDE